MLPHVSAITGATNAVQSATATDTRESLTFRNTGMILDRGRLIAARERLQDEGISAWARRHNFREKSVHDVLSGTRPCTRGKSHAIALALGLKDPINGALKDKPAS